MAVIDFKSLYLSEISYYFAMSDEKIIFSMAGVSKIYPPSKQVLKNIYLSFFYGAKIGVIGLNGSGKSSLLKI
ncbi:ATP-binding cassette domain-containing protein, partial [Brucella sp. 21LCYQ03]|nr:ATP-binding cassette domain-containing protein [Brucella sp. 21LCYQ03]